MNGISLKKPIIIPLSYCLY